jgi:hypothetical protein
LQQKHVRALPSRRGRLDTKIRRKLLQLCPCAFINGNAVS